MSGWRLGAGFAGVRQRAWACGPVGRGLASPTKTLQQVDAAPPRHVCAAGTSGGGGSGGVTVRRSKRLSGGCGGGGGGGDCDIYSDGPSFLFFTPCIIPLCILGCSGLVLWSDVCSLVLWSCMYGGQVLGYFSAYVSIHGLINFVWGGLVLWSCSTPV